MQPKSKKIGRPNKLGKSTLRAFRLPDHEYSMVLQYAAQNEISASEAIRQIIDRDCSPYIQSQSVYVSDRTTSGNTGLPVD